MTTATSLSSGSLLTICKGGQVEKPLVQVLGLKKIAGSSNDRYRVYISDGQYSNSFSMLATQMNDKVGPGGIENMAVIRVNNYICNNLQGKKVIILLDVEVVKKGSEVGAKIGSPIQMSSDGNVGQNGGKASEAGTKRPAPDGDNCAAPVAKRSPLAASENRQALLSPRGAMASQPLDPSTATIFPIASLTPYQNRWTIKARVTNKSDIRRWSNSRGEGHLFNMDLLDESGEIRATAFKDQCDKFYNLIEVGKLYYISSCSLKAANKQFSNLNNEYEMTFRESTEVVPCTEDSSNIPKLAFNFVKIKDLGGISKDSVVDVIGVCKVANEAVSLTTRTGRETTKRDLVLVDQTMTEVGLTLWGTTAETFDGSNNPVIAVKGARVSDFNGVSISTLNSSVLQVNPDLPQAHTLKGWYDTEGSSAETSSLTQAGANRGGGDFGSNIRTLADVRLDTQGREISAKPEYFSTVGYITVLKKENALYQGCSREVDGRTCNKKVLDQQNGMYRCEKCNMEVDNFNWRLILSFCISDMTGQQWVRCFQEQGEVILGITSQELGALFTQDQEQYNAIFANALLKPFNFRVSAKSEYYNDESNIRFTVRSVTPRDPKEHVKYLLKEVEEAGLPLPEAFDKTKFQ